MRAAFFSSLFVTTVLMAHPANAAGDAVKGKSTYGQCMACHKIDASGVSTIGPNLKGVVGRPVGSLKGFKYSPAMKAYGGNWTAERLDAYLAAPMKTIPGNKMPFAGLRNPTDRQNVIAYLQSQK